MAPSVRSNLLGVFFLCVLCDSVVSSFEPHDIMNKSTRFLLILLRLAIGWHLLFAGIAKFQADYRGSEGFLQESTGPLSPFFHWMANDPLVNRLTMQPLGENQDSSKTAFQERFPKALNAEWEGYLEQFDTFYRLDDDQRKEARRRLDQHKEEMTLWILQGVKEIKKIGPVGPPIEVKQKTLERLKEYQDKREQLRAYQRGEYSTSLHTLFGGDKTKELQAEKAAVARLRSDLNKDVEQYTADMKDSLHEVLRAEQTQKGPMPQPLRVGWMRMSRLDWIDFLVRWGLVVAGIGLLVGLFTRTACVLGACLLLSFYLAMPPLPGVPEALRMEGYPYVNKNIVELLALLTLATTASGRWAGLDCFLFYLNPWRKD
jgi:uncharacterized membrane protein YphA (DoxX/SURF4 family)